MGKTPKKIIAKKTPSVLFAKKETPKTEQQENNDTIKPIYSAPTNQDETEYVENLNQTILNLTTENDEMKSKLSDYISENTELRDKVDELSKTIQSLETELKSMSAISETKNLVEEFEKLKKENAELIDKLYQEAINTLKYKTELEEFKTHKDELDAFKSDKNKLDEFKNRTDKRIVDKIKQYRAIIRTRKANGYDSWN